MSLHEPSPDSFVAAHRKIEIGSLKGYFHERDETRKHLHAVQFGCSANLDDKRQVISISISVIVCTALCCAVCMHYRESLNWHFNFVMWFLLCAATSCIDLHTEIAFHFYSMDVSFFSRRTIEWKQCHGHFYRHQ